MKNWQYKFLPNRVDEKVFNQLGAEGWELVGFVMQSLTVPLAVFKKEV